MDRSDDAGDIARMLLRTLRLSHARLLLVCVFSASLGACDRSASRGADDLRTDSTSRVALDTSDIDRAVMTVDTVSGARCEDRTGSTDLERAAERARVERVALQASSGRASREGRALLLTLPSHRQLAFIDCDAQSESWLQHQYEGLDAVGGGHVISVSYYEGGATQWVHATSGQVVSLASAPVFSPDGAHFAIANADLEAGYSDNIFAIYRVTDAGAVEVFREDGGDEFGAATPVWTDASTVQFTRVHRASTPGQLLHLAVTATRVGAAWRVDPEPPPPLSP